MPQQIPSPAVDDATLYELQPIDGIEFAEIDKRLQSHGFAKGQHRTGKYMDEIKYERSVRSSTPINWDYTVEVFEQHDRVTGIRATIMGPLEDPTETVERENAKKLLTLIGQTPYEGYKPSVARAWILRNFDDREGRPEKTIGSAQLSIAGGEFVVIMNIQPAKAEEAAPGSAPEYREFKSRTGKFTVTARVIAVENGVVELERQDNNKRIKVEVSRLSEADQEWLEKHYVLPP